MTLNGQQFTASQAEYTYYAPSRVSASSPTSGPVGGDTSIFVYGARFQGGLAYICRFGSANVNATYLSDSQLACISPANAAGAQSLEVSIDAFNFTSDALPFAYYSEPEVTELAPTGGPTMPGGTMVVVRGPTFTSGSDYRCKFGAMIVRGHLEDDGNMTCTSPEQSVAGDVSVEVTLNGQQYSRSAVRFAYYEAESVARLSPSSGLIGGSTVVRVLGSGFRPFEEGLCRFGDLSVNATWVSGRRCAACQPRQRQLPTHRTKSGCDSMTMRTS